MFLAVFSLVALAVLADDEIDACWIQTHNRGVGKPISACPDGLERSGLLCYNKCDEGYKGVGPVCWHNNGTSYGRGFGRVLTCAEGLEYQDGLCYKPCPERFSPYGPVCWERCPNETPFRCGLMCTDTQAECSDQMLTNSMVGLNVLGGIGAIGASVVAVIGTGGLATLLAAFGITGGSVAFLNGLIGASQQLHSYPLCSNSTEGNGTISEARREIAEKLKAQCIPHNH